MCDGPQIREQHLKESKEIPWVKVRVRVSARARIRVWVRLKCIYYSIGVHTKCTSTTTKDTPRFAAEQMKLVIT